MQEAAFAVACTMFGMLPTKLALDLRPGLILAVDRGRHRHLGLIVGCDVTISVFAFSFAFLFLSPFTFAFAFTFTSTFRCGLMTTSFIALALTLLFAFAFTSAGTFFRSGMGPRAFTRPVLFALPGFVPAVARAVAFADMCSLAFVVLG